MGTKRLGKVSGPLEAVRHQESPRTDPGGQVKGLPAHEENVQVTNSRNWESGRSLSIVVPTRNEAGNIRKLVHAIQQALPRVLVEIIFVDDSDDNTPTVVEGIRQQEFCQVRLIHRPAGEQRDGLGGAVKNGIAAASAPWVCIMDADFQHPPDLLPHLLDQAKKTNADVIVATRYAMQGNSHSFTFVRRSVSQVSATLAKTIFPSQLRGVTDPLSGFFLLRKAAVDTEALRPCGFKILLEILVRTPGLQVAEVGYSFGKRHAGKSKASLQEGMRFLSHLTQLRFNADLFSTARFLGGGAVVMALNLFLLALITELFHVHYLGSAALATQGAALGSFALMRPSSVRDRSWGQVAGNGRAYVATLAGVLVLNNIALMVRMPMIYALTTSLGVHYVLSTFISLLVIAILQFAIPNVQRLTYHGKSAYFL